MRTQSFLNTIRLLTYTIFISLFAYSATANTKTDSALFSGGGEGEKSTQEERIELEQWMLERENFYVSETNKSTKTTEEHPLASWMINGDFEIKNNSENKERNPLESWMLNQSNFQIKDNNNLENWMMKRRCFKTEEVRDFGEIKDWMLSKNSFTI